MAVYRNRRWFVERPHAAMFVLMAINIIVFLLTMRQSAGTTISTAVLLADGAMYTLAIERHEYWRLIAYGFLHADLLHIATNMFCLVLWGGPLERRVGSFYFLVIYFCAMIAGGLASNFHHVGPYLAVGASGAISGILGALLCLWILGRIDLSANFFLVNIGLNAAIAAMSPRIDWAAHVGGLTAGLIACALLDLVERVTPFVLRCKFPEFVKVNGGILAAVLAAVIWSNVALVRGGPENWLIAAAFAAACVVVIKLADLLLSAKKGLAVLVIVFAVANAVLVAFAVTLMAANPSFGCAAGQMQRIDARAFATMLVDLACANQIVTMAVLAVCAFAVTLLLYLQTLTRGINDVGFIGAAMVAERKRRQGI
jgi:membrane associated rhomboid family serine protease